MAKTPIQTPTIMRQTDFELTSSSRLFSIGYREQFSDMTSDTAKPYMTVYEYHQAGEALSQYGVYTLKGSASGIVASVMTDSGTSAGYARVIVPQTAVTNGYYFWGAVKGLCTAAHTAAAGQNMTVGTLFELAANATTLTPKTDVNATATAPAVIRDVNSIGFSTGLSATSANISIYLFGDPCIMSFANCL